jgi:plasmid maintenance system antidote protein VapI
MEKQKINKIKAWSFEKNLKTQHLARPIKKKKIQINKIINESEGITTHASEIKRIKTDCDEQLHANK